MSKAVNDTAGSVSAKHALKSVIQRFKRSKDGAAAVEYALVAAPFLALVFAILETALVFFASQVLETAAADSARLILTGQAQTSGLNQTQFKQEVCNRIYGLFDCNSGIKVDVRTYNSFSSANMSKPIDANGNVTFTPSYQPGSPGDIIVVRLLYEWPVYVSLLGLNLSDLSNGKRLIMATSAFRNEPYQ